MEFFLFLAFFMCLLVGFLLIGFAIADGDPIPSIPGVILLVISVVALGFAIQKSNEAYDQRKQEAFDNCSTVYDGKAGYSTDGDVVCVLPNGTVIVGVK
jgi:hypothetical protein